MQKPEDLSYAIELHDVDAIDKYLASGIHPNDQYKNEIWFGHLVSMYTRSPRFSGCVKVFIKHGLQWETPALLAVLALMHVCAEFNHVACAEVLLEHGADIDQPADVDEAGFGGQTALFHTVNQNNNQSAEMMQWLLQKGSDPMHFIKGVYWGKNMPWETLVPGVNAISYAMMGRLPQFHRDEKTTAAIVQNLMKYAYNQSIELPNIPNKYLNS